MMPLVSCERGGDYMYPYYVNLNTIMIRLRLESEMMTITPRRPLTVFPFKICKSVNHDYE